MVHNVKAEHKTVVEKHKGKMGETSGFLIQWALRTRREDYSIEVFPYRPTKAGQQSIMIIYILHTRIQE
jgi:hypothetical protein